MAQLDSRAVDDGRAFVQALDRAGIVVTAALWLSSTRDGSWTYLLASPLVGTDGAMPVKIAAVLATMPAGFAINRSNLRLHGPDAGPIRVLHTIVQTGPAPGIYDIRMSGNQINGVRIGDVVGYRLHRRGR